MDDVILTRRTALAAAGGLALPFAAPGAVEAKAELRGASFEPFRRFRLGALEVTVFCDAAVMIDGPWPIVGEDRPKDEIERLMRESLLPPARFRPGFSPVAINDGSRVLLIDTGNGADGFVPRPAGGRLLQSLAASGLSPDQIDVIALTHCHVDHLGGVVENGRLQFPNARVVVGADERSYWSDPARLGAPDGSVELRSAKLFAAAMPLIGDRLTLIGPGDEVFPGVTALAASGHTPGHLAFHVESAGRRLLIWGDCAHHEVASLAHPEWSAFFDADKEQGKATRKRIYEMAATERLPVLGYHTSFPSLGFVARDGGGYRWIPESYQLAE